PLVTLQHNYQLPPVGRSFRRKVACDGEMRGVKAKTLYPQRPESWSKEDSWPLDTGQGVRAGPGRSAPGKSIGYLPTNATGDQEARVDRRYPWLSSGMPIAVAGAPGVASGIW